MNTQQDIAIKWHSLIFKLIQSQEFNRKTFDSLIQKAHQKNDNNTNKLRNITDDSHRLLLSSLAEEDPQSYYMHFKKLSGQLNAENDYFLLLYLINTHARALKSEIKDIRLSERLEHFFETVEAVLYKEYHLTCQNTPSQQSLSKKKSWPAETYQLDLQDEILLKNKALIFERERIKLLTDALPVLISYVDKYERYRFVNRAYLVQNKTSEENILKKTVKEIVGPDNYQKIKPLIQKALKGEVVKEERHLIIKGEEFYNSINYMPHKASSGEILGFYAFIYDVTHLKKVEKSLETSIRALQTSNLEKAELLKGENLIRGQLELEKNKLHQLFMDAPVLIAVSRGKDLVYELANPLYKKVFSNHSDIEGKSIFDVMPDLNDESKKALARALEGERFSHNEMPITHDWDNSREPYSRYFSIIYQPTKNIHNEVDGVITLGYDVTDQFQSNLKLNELNLELKKNNEELQRINNELDQFVYIASHDLKAPLNNSEGILNYLKINIINKMCENDQKLFDKASESLSILKRRVECLGSILEEQSDADAEPSYIKFEEVVADILEELHPSIAITKVKISTDFQVPEIRYLLKKLRSIISNLLSNAIKYRREGIAPAIMLRSFIKNDQVFLTIKDNGKGIDERHLSNLFKLFYRIDKNIEGNGIGLYIVKRIIESYNGSIKVKSKVGEGTEFIIRF